MADTWSGTNISELVERRAIWDGESTGALQWSSDGPSSSWAADDLYPYWSDIALYVDLDAGHPTGVEYPTKSELVAYLVEPPSAPTEQPSSAALTNPSTTLLQLDWDNTNTTDPITTVYEAWESVVGPTGQRLEYQGSNDISAGSTQDTFTPTEQGGTEETILFRGRLRYYNTAGYGPWSTYSNWQSLTLT